MTATNVICQPQHKCVHLATDAAIYTMDGIVREFGNKAFTVPHWPGAIASRGLANVLSIIGFNLSSRFASFDTCVTGIHDALREQVEALGIAEPCQFVVVGWSADRGRPEAYAIETSAELPPGAAELLASDPSLVAPDAYRLLQLGDMVQGPIPSAEIVRAARYTGLPADASHEQAMDCFRKIFEMQRRSTLADGVVWVGGFAQVTTVTPHGVEQRILHRWPEDQVGQLIEPRPIDWTRFGEMAGNDSAGMSRAKRDLSERKARNKLRIVS